MRLAPILLRALAALSALSSLPSQALESPAPAPTATAAESAAQFRLWAKAKAPTLSGARAIGSYSAGCVAGAQALPLDGPGYAVMRPARLRYYGHPELLAYIEGLAERLQKERMPLLLVGDMGRPRGGPTLSGHLSHQIGLDVDLWYHLSKQRPNARARERWGASHLVLPNGTLSRLWTADTRKLVELAASAPEVDRIFVHAALKRDLCKRAPGAAWLAKLRPWWGHDDHLHVRLHCPEASAECQAQEPVNNPEHCGRELDWWFSAEARAEAAKKSAGPGRVFPLLPAACQALVAEYEETTP